MRCHWIFIFIFLSLASEARPSMVFNELDEHLLPVKRIVPIVPIIQVKKPEQASNPGPMKRVPSIEDLHPPYWQEIFYERHHSGPQHFLICASDNTLFEFYLAALLRLMQCNDQCRVTIVAPADEHHSLRIQVKALIIEQVKPNHGILRDLHFIEQPAFEEMTSKKEIVRETLNRDRYTAIILACPRSDYRQVKRWLHISRAMLYIPYTRNPKNIRDKLYSVGFRTHEVLTADTMICAATSDHSTFPKEMLRPGHNPDRVETPKIKRGIHIERDCPECGSKGKNKGGQSEDLNVEGRQGGVLEAKRDYIFFNPDIDVRLLKY